MDLDIKEVADKMGGKRVLVITSGTLSGGWINYWE